MAQTVCVVLSTVERERLVAIAADRKHVERARIVLASAERHSAQRVGVSRLTVSRWQQRFAEAGVEDLLCDKPRKPGKAPLAAETTPRVSPSSGPNPPTPSSPNSTVAMYQPSDSVH